MTKELISVDEVFAMAVQIEKNAADFYRSVADRREGDKELGFLKKLAAMEEAHAETFKGMRGRASAGADGASLDLAAEGGMFVAAVLDGFELEGSPRIAESLSGNKSVEELLGLAMGLEKEGIIFYTGIRDALPVGPTTDSIDRVIKEEKEHLVTLARELRSVRGE